MVNSFCTKVPMFRFVLGACLIAWLAVNSSSVTAQTIRESRQLIIEAESLEELESYRFVPERMRSIFTILMRDIIREDPDKIDELIFHTHELIEKHQRENEDGYFEDSKPRENRNHITDFLKYYELTNESFEIIGVMTRVLRKDQRGVVQFDGVTSFVRKNAFFSQFLLCGGNYNCEQALDKLFEEVRTVAGEGEYIYLLTDFFELCYELRPRQRDQLVKWAYTKADSPEPMEVSIGRAALLGASIWARAEHAKIKSNQVLEGNQLDSRILEILRDDSISPSWRIGIGAMLGIRFPEEISSSVRIEIGRLLNDTFIQEIMIEKQAIVYCLSAFLGGPENNSPEWLQVGKQLLASAAKMSGFKSGQFYQPSINDRLWIAKSTALACRVGDQKQIEKQVKTYSEEHTLYPNLWIELIKHKQYELAYQLFTEHAYDLRYESSRFSFDNCYDSKLAENTDAYLEIIEEENDRLFSELLLAGVKNPHPRHQFSVPTTRQQRLQKFADKYSVLPNGWSGEEELRAFEVLSLGWDSKQISSWLEEHQIGLVNRLVQDSPKVHPYWAGRIELHNAIEKIAKGMEFPALVMWGRIIKDENKSIDSRRRYLTEAFLELLNEQIDAALGNQDVEKLTALAKFSRHVVGSFEVDNHISSNNLYRIMVRAVVAHAFIGEVDKWDEVWTALERPNQNHLTQILARYQELIPTVEAIMNPVDSTPGKWLPDDNHRQRFIAALLSIEWVNEGYVGSSALAESASANLLTESDIDQIAEIIARSSARGGSSWREFLGNLADQGRIEDGLREVEDEIKLLGVDQASLQYVLKLEKYLMLRSMGRTTEAVEFEKEITDIDPSIPREYSEITRALELR